MNILIADDDATSALALEMLAEEQGHSARVARDGVEAWEALQVEHYPILIVDWMMPRMDGLELCRRIRARTGTPYTCIIMLTVKESPKDRWTALSAGVDVFLSKPLNHDDMVARLQVAQRILDLESSEVSMPTTHTGLRISRQSSEA